MPKQIVRNSITLRESSVNWVSSNSSALLRFSEGTGANIADRTSKLPLVFTGTPGWGNPAYGVTFDGTQYLLFPSSNAFLTALDFRTFVGSFVVSFEIYLSALPSATEQVFCIGRNGTGSNSKSGNLGFGVNSSGNYQTYMRPSSIDDASAISTIQQFASSFNPGINKLHTVQIEYNFAAAGADHVTLYIDGAAAISGSYTTTLADGNRPYWLNGGQGVIGGRLTAAGVSASNRLGGNGSGARIRNFGMFLFPGAANDAASLISDLYQYRGEWSRFMP